jgi:hypothetical protein
MDAGIGGRGGRETELAEESIAVAVDSYSKRRGLKVYYIVFPPTLEMEKW